VPFGENGCVARQIRTIPDLLRWRVDPTPARGGFVGGLWRADSELTDRVRAVLGELGVELSTLYRVPFWALVMGAKLLRPMLDKRGRRGLDNLPMFRQYAETKQYFDNTQTIALRKDSWATPRSSAQPTGSSLLRWD
jgi:hypothetical protein